MGVVCAKSLKQIKLQNTPVITTRLVFICFFFKELNCNIDFPTFKTSFHFFPRT